MDNAHIEDRAPRAADTVAAVSSLAGDAKAQVEEMANQAAAAVGEAYGQARDQVRGAAAAVATSIERQPGIALLAVGLICGAIGFLLARR